MRSLLASVILPTRGRPHMLPVAVESVLAQTCGDWELVILDNTPEPYYPTSAWDDTRIRYRHELCDGIADASTRALRLARGEVIVPLADDDRLAPTCVETIRRVFSDPAVRWANAITEIRDEHGRVTGHRGGTPDSVASTVAGSFWLGGAVWWRREMTATFGYDPRFDGAADMDLYLRFVEQADPVLVPEVMYLYLDHPGTDSRQRLPVQIEHSATIAQEWRSRRAEVTSAV